MQSKYGEDYITLRELWDHTREFAEITHTPGGYNEEEAKAQLAMQDVFIRGEANGFVSVLSHPDAVRYVQVWEKSEEGDVISKQIDLFSTTGRDFTNEESVQLIHHLAEYQGSTPVIHAEVESTYAHFFVSEGNTVRENDIRTIAIAQSFVREEIRPSGMTYTQERTAIRHTISETSHRTIEDMKLLFGEYLHRTHKKFPENQDGVNKKPLEHTKHIAELSKVTKAQTEKKSQPSTTDIKEPAPEMVIS